MPYAIPEAQNRYIPPIRCLKSSPRRFFSERIEQGNGHPVKHGQVLSSSHFAQMVSRVKAGRTKGPCISRTFLRKVQTIWLLLWIVEKPKSTRVHSWLATNFVDLMNTSCDKVFFHELLAGSVQGAFKSRRPQLKWRLHGRYEIISFYFPVKQLIAHRDTIKIHPSSQTLNGLGPSWLEIKVAKHALSNGLIKRLVRMSWVSHSPFNDATFKYPSQKDAIKGATRDVILKKTSSSSATHRFLPCKIRQSFSWNMLNYNYRPTSSCLDSVMRPRCP